MDVVISLLSLVANGMRQGLFGNLTGERGFATAPALEACTEPMGRGFTSKLSQQPFKSFIAQRPPFHIAREHETVAAHLFHLFEKAHCGGGERHDMGLAVFHPLARYGPRPLSHVDFGPNRMPHLT